MTSWWLPGRWAPPAPSAEGVVRAVFLLGATLFYARSRVAALDWALSLWEARARAAVWMVLARLPGAAAVPRVQRLLTPAHLAQALGRPVHGLALEDGFHGGFVGRMLALRVELADAPAGAPPLHLVLKTTPPTWAAHVRSILFRQYREAAFYVQLAPQLPAGLAPRCHFARGHRWSGDATLLLERVRGTRVGALLGNQCWGPPPRADAAALLAAAPPDRFAVAAAAVEALAAVHARFWGRADELAGYRFLKGSDWLRGGGRARWERGIATLRRSWAAVLATYAGGTARVAWSPAVLRAVDYALDATSWAAFQAELADLRAAGRLTLCHNDCHGGNILWCPGAPPRVVFVDWAEVRPRPPLPHHRRFGSAGCRLGPGRGPGPVRHCQLHRRLSPRLRGGPP
jgi:hypothetical protein